MFKTWFRNSKLDKTLEDIETSYEGLLNTLDAFNGEVEMPIGRKKLEGFKMLKWEALNSKVKIRRRKNLFGDYLNFDTIMKKGGEFGRHFHDDIIESCEIISGRMQDLETNIIYEADDVMHYDRGQHHTPIALEDTVLKVIFKP